MVEINETCIDCKRCHNYCPVKAISSDGNGMSIVDFDACVECGTCYRAGARALSSLKKPYSNMRTKTTSVKLLAQLKKQKS